MKHVIILEGLNATGKTFCAQTLQKELSIPIIRPFRQHQEHLGVKDQGIQDHLRSYGVPANTYVDDFYTSDFLIQSEISAILDRSMGSGVAYGLLYGDIPDSKFAKVVFMEWQERLEDYPGQVLYVHTSARRDIRKQRCKKDKRHILSVDQEKKLEKWFDQVFKSIVFDKMVLDTSDMPVGEIGKIGVGKIHRRLR